MTKEDARLALRDLLYKLSIRSAEVTHLERMMRHVMNSYGQPDQMFMTPSVFSTFLETFGEKKDDKQEGDSDAGDSSDPLRDWFSLPTIIRNPGKK